MTRWPVLTLALLAAGSAARAQASRPAPTPPAQTPAQVAASTTQSGVQSPTDTAVPPVQTIGWIRVGQTRNGVLENNDFRMGDNTWADVWYFDGTAGQNVVIVLTPRTFDGYVQLLDPAGNILAQGNHSGSLREARVAFTLTAAGRYQIVVNNEGSDVKTGPYTLSLR